MTMLGQYGSGECCLSVARHDFVFSPESHKFNAGLVLLRSGHRRGGVRGSRLAAEQSKCHRRRRGSRSSSARRRSRFGRLPDSRVGIRPRRASELVAGTSALPVQAIAPARRSSILDFGSQVSQLIARRAREANVYSELVPFDAPWDEIAKREPAAIVLSGGPESTFGDDALDCDPRVYESGVPLLGICYGMQLLVKRLRRRARAARSQRVRPGAARASTASTRRCFSGVPARVARVDVARRLGRELPAGLHRARAHRELDVAAMGDDGAQDLRDAVPSRGRAHRSGHARSSRTFCTRSPGSRRRGGWTRWSTTRSRRFARRSASDNVMCALSGGVDSAVAATLVARAIGKQLTCIFVDTGLMRKDESTGVVAAFRDVLHLNVIHVDARERFSRGSPGVEDPEEKRIRIGHEFIAIFEEEAKKIPDVRFLVQGTLYPDVIESKTPGSKAGHKIKSHHNVGGLPGADGARSGRAAARALQGRGARSRPRARAARTRSSSASRSRARAGRAHHRRRHARAARHRARSRLDRHERDRRRDRAGPALAASVAILRRAHAGARASA